MSDSVLEQQLTCSICTEILFDPVTYLDCLHTNCGSCSRSWFNARPTATCPQCRQPIRDVRANAAITSLLEDFLERFPERKRSEQEKQDCRTVYKPGDDIFRGRSPLSSAASASSTLAALQIFLRRQDSAGFSLTEEANWMRASTFARLSQQQRPGLSLSSSAVSMSSHPTTTPLAPRMNPLFSNPFRRSRSPSVGRGSDDEDDISGFPSLMDLESVFGPLRSQATVPQAQEDGRSYTDALLARHYASRHGTMAGRVALREVGNGGAAGGSSRNSTGRTSNANNRNSIASVSTTNSLRHAGSRSSNRNSAGSSNTNSNSRINTGNNTGNDNGASIPRNSTTRSSSMRSGHRDTISITPNISRSSSTNGNTSTNSPSGRVSTITPTTLSPVAHTLAELFREMNLTTLPTITCNGCSASIGTNLHYECAACVMFHFCAPCYNSSRRCPSSVSDPRHVLLPQRATITVSEPRPHIQTGIFCSVCEEWCDEDRDERTAAQDSFFWQCEGCNDGHWVYCQSCLVRGMACSHPLVLWTNSRGSAAVRTQRMTTRTSSATPSSSSSLAIITPAAASQIVFGPPKETITAHLPASMGPGFSWLDIRGYMRWPHYRLICDVCHHTIQSWNSWLHCERCDNGGWDVCHNCTFFLPDLPGEPSASSSSSTNFRSSSSIAHPRGANRLCHNYHPLSVFCLSQSPATGLTLKTLHRPPLQGIDAFPVAASPRKYAVAVQHCWNAEKAEDRKWGGGHQLCFPKGAKIDEVVRASEDGGVVWWWGRFAGVGGIFPERVVRIEEEA
ncbi:hypothetical protein EX30DRAFT_371142 [Ascodesmis nigricans]|uniref:RING-type domain-containing protein n=1 Tax=Ascodesmis nigricans TaxID=341454 RepID=A0A4S2MYZ7_9PEZI|nr:hypothetical protein EX30DRAFT_371142 [Ascodesmis nigricans]